MMEEVEKINAIIDDGVNLNQECVRACLAVKELGEKNIRKYLATPSNEPIYCSLAIVLAHLLITDEAALVLYETPELIAQSKRLLQDSTKQNFEEVAVIFTDLSRLQAIAGRRGNNDSGLRLPQETVDDTPIVLIHHERVRHYTELHQGYNPVIIHECIHTKQGLLNPLRDKDNVGEETLRSLFLEGATEGFTQLVLQDSNITIDDGVRVYEEEVSFVFALANTAKNGSYRESYELFQELALSTSDSERKQIAAKALFDVDVVSEEQHQILISAASHYAHLAYDSNLTDREMYSKAKQILQAVKNGENFEICQ